ncbi:ATP-dependent DNA helicase DinG [Listeria sp. PSOL-1]|uniref:ATP-dependent DNA helicase DinG n=1 Tax=Listeria sp. PSOL-1 TaxID=1844999 RepID=UPI0013D355DC|nr:ATP-dependent DNA helicase DinG [Listeria sp. PSOL-1]
MGQKHKRYMVVDLETTGNQANRSDRMIQFAAVLVENNQIIQTYSSFVNPNRPIPAFIKELTGITEEDVRNAPEFQDIAPVINSLLEDTIFVAHNVNFDWTFLQKEMERAEIEIASVHKLDTVELARILYPGVDSYKLQDLSDEFGLTHNDPHKADSDALVTAELLIQLLHKLESLPLAVIQKMSSISQSLKSYLPSLIFEIEMRKGRKVETLPAHLLEYRGLVIQRKSIEKPSYSHFSAHVFPKTNQAKMKLFGKANAPLYVRNGQFEMMDLVHQAMESKSHALIEAGTGIGKSLGYFLPALYFAKGERLPVIISTYTNLLQSQLFQKDVKLVEQLTDLPVVATLLKGRDHYLNLFKFEQLLYEVDTQYDVVVTKLKLLVWLMETKTGDIDEVNLSSGGKLFWNRMKHTGWFLPEDKDPWLDYDFYKFNVEQAKHADLVIVNHALLLQDHFTKKSRLPEYSYAVIDEAHHFADSVRDQWSFSLTYRKMKYFLNQLGSLEKYSLLSRLEMIFEGESSLFDLNIAAFKLGSAIDAFFTELKTLLYNKNKQQVEVTLTDDLFYTAENLVTLLFEVVKNMTALLEKGKQKSRSFSEQEIAFIEETYSFLLDWEHMAAGLKQMINQHQAFSIVILECDKNYSLSSLKITNMSGGIENKLADHFFDTKDSVVMTSATLTVKDSFDYIKKKLGLNRLADRLIEAKIASPFKYAKHAKILIPNDMSPIKSTPLLTYTEQLANYLSHIAVKTSGRMLVLFTASEMLDETFKILKSNPVLAEFVILAQGRSSGSTDRLTRQFQLFDKAILLGTTSFWEGIDIPGEALSCLVIVRLPFAPLDDPYTKAQIELLKSQGENAFQNYSLPEAILRFKQGFGRLIRRETDRGLIFIFDNRIDTTHFGKAFLSSIPDVPIIKANQSQLLDETAEFFKGDQD